MSTSATVPEAYRLSFAVGGLLAASESRGCDNDEARLLARPEPTVSAGDSHD